MSSPFKTNKRAYEDMIADEKTLSDFDKSDAFDNVGPEIKSYIYQTISEFEPYSTPQTVVAVIAKDPLKLRAKMLEQGVEVDAETLRQMYRISISLTEDGGKLEEEGLHEDIFEAIKIAKDKLLKNLYQIQDEVMSNQDRKIQIDSALGGGHIH